MVQFTRYGATGIYLAGGTLPGASCWAFVLTAKGADPPAETPLGPLSLAEALAWRGDGWISSFVQIAAGAERITADPASFTAGIAGIRADSFPGPGAIIFLPTVEAALDSNAIYIVVLADSGGGVAPLNFFNVTLTGVAGVDAVFDTGVVLSVPDDAGDAFILFAPPGPDSSPAISLGGPAQPTQGLPATNVSKLCFEGASSGAFVFDVAIGMGSLCDDLDMGFQLLIRNPKAAEVPPDESAIPYLAALLPLADPAGGEDGAVQFRAEVNILNPNNEVAGAARTAFFFTGETKTASAMGRTELSSYYRTNYGKTVTLIPVAEAGPGVVPARLVINPGNQKSVLQNGFRFAPEGDFILSVAGAEPGSPVSLLCGLSGTETISFLPEIDGAQQGERMRFISDRPGNAPQFPLAPVSPVGAPIGPKAQLLDAAYRTSWASFVAPPGDPARCAHYAAAPKGAELFGLVAGSGDGMLGPQNPGVGLPPDGSVVFPLFPLAGFPAGSGEQDMTSEELELLARQIVGPTRKSAITQGVEAGLARTSASSTGSLRTAAFAAGAGALTSTTTPTGFITRYDAGGGWKQLLLAQVTNGGAVTVQMGFTDLDDRLQAAFQTTDQFLVVANNAHLGSFAGGNGGPRVFMPPASPEISDAAHFFNRIDVGQWSFAARPGVDNAYGDYRSVILVKGVKGRILDVGADGADGAATPASLAMSPDKWTMKEVFASPDPPDTSQLVPLSSWLVDYCKDAYDKRDDPYFAKFAAIVTDPDWTGVLILKAEIAEIPSDVVGILAGVKDRSDFYAHHIGIDIGQIDGAKVEQRDTTSMFGLVHYVDPRYDDGVPPHTIAPLDLDAAEDFSLLTLKALFENSAVAKFDSLAQLVLNRIFGSDVESMTDVKPEGRKTNPNNALLLQGGIQKNGDAVVYTLSSKWPNQYALNNNVLGSVEIDTAEMSTRDDGAKSGEIVSWVGMTGFMNFTIVPAIPDPDSDSGGGLPAFDIFSYGPEAGDDTALRQGLSFNNLGLEIRTKAGDGDNAPAKPVLRLVESEIAFDGTGSHARDRSLFKNFQLELSSLLSGDAGGAGSARSDPASLGYLPVVTQYELRGLGGRWHGLQFKLDLGTPGALAGKVKLESSLLVAWADDSGAANPDSRAAMVGIQLPGAGGGGELFSLQTVIKLSIGLIQLMYTAPDDDAGKSGGFLLVMNQIALKLLGLLKLPPSGNTAFLLFGDPDAADAARLGWFAVYNKAKADEKPSKAAVLRSDMN